MDFRLIPNTSSAARRCAARQRVDQSRYVDDRAARNVDEDARRTKSLQDCGVDDAARRLAA